MTQAIQSHIAHVVKDAPPLAVGGIVLFGVELSEWVLILTVIYTLIRIAVEIHEWYKRNRNE